MIHNLENVERLTESMGAVQVVSLLKQSEEELPDYKDRILRAMWQKDWVIATKLIRRMTDSLLIIGDGDLEHLLQQISTYTLRDSFKVTLIPEVKIQLEQTINDTRRLMKKLYLVETRS